MLFGDVSYGASLIRRRRRKMECWNSGMMGLKKPVFQPSTTPSFHAAYQEKAAKSVVIRANCRKFDTLVIYLSQAINQAVKIIITIKLDFNFALVSAFFNHDLGSEVTGEVFSEA